LKIQLRKVTEGLMMSFAKMTLVGAAAGAVAFSVSLSTASAYSVNLATGLDSLGILQTSGGGTEVDANWKLTAGGNNPLDTGPYPKAAYVVGPGDADQGFGGGWVPNGPNSSWIAANPLDAGGNGLMTFTRMFYLSNPSAASIINGFATLDDSGVLTLNGNTLLDLPDGAWFSLSPFSATSSDFVMGWNTLTIQVTDTDNFLEGARVEGTLLVIPELSTWAMMTLGFAGLGFVSYRGSRKTVAFAA
jgi:hypothetical protein